jgi:hypothetical protein
VLGRRVWTHAPGVPLSYPLGRLFHLNLLTRTQTFFVRLNLRVILLINITMSEAMITIAVLVVAVFSFLDRLKSLAVAVQASSL